MGRSEFYNFDFLLLSLVESTALGSRWVWAQTLALISGSCTPERGNLSEPPRPHL